MGNGDLVALDLNLSFFELGGEGNLGRIALGHPRRCGCPRPSTLGVEACPDDPIPEVPPTVYLFPTAAEPYAVLPGMRITAWVTSAEGAVLTAFTNAHDQVLDAMRSAVTGIELSSEAVEP